MKHLFSKKNKNTGQLIQSWLVFALALVAQLSHSSYANAQTGTGEASIKLTYTESNNRHKILTATVKTKIDDSDQLVKGVSIHFYNKSIKPDQLLGSAISNEKGEAVLVIPDKKLSLDTAYTFIGAIEQDKQFANVQETLKVAEADLVMTLKTEDSTHQVVITMQGTDKKGKLVPAADVEVNLYVQRLFGLLPLPDNPETTDENGEITVDFPRDLPGDADGNLIIVARVEENDRYGNLEFRRKMNWGIPLLIDPRLHSRELWSSRANAPIYLIVLVNTILICIWGVIAYIVYEVFLIKKIGKQGSR